MILLSEKFGTYLREWKRVDERIWWIRLKVEETWVIVVQVYAPTEDSNLMIKDDIFQKMQETVGSGNSRAKFKEARAKVYMAGGDVEKAWKEPD